jgi:hypothetical protein
LAIDTMLGHRHHAYVSNHIKNWSTCHPQHTQISSNSSTIATVNRTVCT